MKWTGSVLEALLVARCGWLTADEREIHSSATNFLAEMRDDLMNGLTKKNPCPTCGHKAE